jgi:hypothetical protein
LFIIAKQFLNFSIYLLRVTPAYTNQVNILEEVIQYYTSLTVGYLNTSVVGEVLYIILLGVLANRRVSQNQARPEVTHTQDKCQ